IATALQSTDPDHPQRRRGAASACLGKWCERTGQTVTQESCLASVCISVTFRNLPGMSRDSRYLEAILHHDIPLTRSLGLRVEQWENHELRLQVPLQPNINHKSSMFGGSLYCASVLAGWGWLHLRLREAGIEDGHIVIHEGKIEYPLPVVDDAMAICSAPTPEAWERFESI